MGQRGTKVSPLTIVEVCEQHLSAPPKPGTNMAVQHPHPRDETPVGAGGGGEEGGGVRGDGAGVGEEGGGVRGDGAGRKEAGRVEEKRKRKKWWQRLHSFFRAAKKQPPESSSVQGEVQQQQDEEEKRKVAWAGRSSDDYIFSRYTVGDQLGKGGFGVVYEGRRLCDDLKVAVKYVTKTKDMECIVIPDHPNPLPKEIALTILANKGPSVPEIIRLLDWTDHPDHFVMVLECPCPCENLEEFIRRHGGRLNEETTRRIMWQVAQAANTCFLRGVLHRDIKLENLLINRETSNVKLIDFGCGDILVRSPYRSYHGTAAYSPPEYQRMGRYYGGPATVWSLGVVMFELLYGHLPCDYDLFRLHYKRCSKTDLSKECCHLLRALLHEKPSRRLGLGRIMSHNWFKLCVLRSAVGDTSIPSLAFASCGVSKPRVASCALA
ncbi:serine/threonine-protein kinase pim-1-like [Garra rufa]|uniref:serine/threonine-protein kinase pim-1-like n=1 Tax=Garra rufa TaxID=137080 RepID=UPI003CCE938F